VTTQSTAPHPAPSTVTTPRAEPVALPVADTRRVTVVFVSLAVSLVVVSIVSAGMGQLPVPPGEVVGSIVRKFGLDWGSAPSAANGEAVLWNVRFPRIVMAVLVGAALGAAGAAMQGTFGNPLAEPAVVGVSSGAAVGACLVIVFEWTLLGAFTTPAFAFLFGLLTTLAVYAFARENGRTQVVTLVLTGIAVNALAAGLIGYLVFLGDSQAREQIVFWQLGSFNGSRWDAVDVVAPCIAVGLVAAFAISRRLDLLALGDRAARHLGVDVERTRLVAIVVVALLVSTGVAFVGVIAFVGLVVAHLVRMVIGPAHRTLVPASALAGALVLVSADLVARTAVDYADLPIGMLTAVIGGPVFFVLLRRTRANAGGWA
jgi:iron complex transport system permease protein